MSESSSGQRPDFWPDCGHAHTLADARGWLTPQPAYWAVFLKRPELVLVPESCAAEIRLHRNLQSNPLLRVNEASLALLQDEDARSNYRMFIRFRDAVQSSVTLEGFYLDMLHQGAVAHPPLFIDLLVQTMLRGMLENTTDPLLARAAELLFRQQRISVQDGQLLSADAQALDDMNEDGGLGAIGRLLKESQAPLRDAQLRVLNADNANAYWQHTSHRFVLDLSHEMTQTLSHGLTLKLAKARSGLKALSDVLVMWVQHFLGVKVRIEPVPSIDDQAWRWHTGLDSSSTALLNALYQGQTLAPDALSRLVSLFKLRFDDESQVQEDMHGKPVYLGLAMTADNTVKLKPQNLLLNLPLKPASLR